MIHRDAIADTGERAAARFASHRIPAWLALALPAGDGPAPVIEALGEDGPRTALVQCRTVFTLAHLSRLTARPELLGAAHRIHGFVTAHLRDDDGGCRVAVAHDGAPLDDPQSRLRRSYDQSFALLALAALLRAGSDRVTEDDLEALWIFIGTHLTDARTGALREDDRDAAGAAIRAQNPQMHMLEALLEAHEATGQPVWLERAGVLVGLAERYFIDPASGSIREFVGPELEPLGGAQGARREPGHQFEWAWLLRRYAQATGNPAPIAAARRMQAFAEAHGIRRDGPLAGAPLDALDASGAPCEATHLLWPLTEAGKLYAMLSETDATAGARTLAIADLIFGRYFAPGDAPHWVNQLDGEGRVIWDTALSRLLYHVALFVTEGGRAGLWRLDGQVLPETVSSQEETR